ncbi:MAG: PHP domain-containing protein [Spirochaetes bacterium]|nr:PHP domain-containing protein [Spirochaetota bacterium]
MVYKSDLHIHSCLSPCGDLEMSPSDIIQTAKSKGLNLIALTDHNSAMNCPALNELCMNDGEISCFFGIEVTSEEEVHILTLFDRLDSVMEFSDLIYKSLPEIYNDPDKFGDQVYVDSENNIIGEVDKYLGSPSGYNIASVIDKVHSLGGLVIPAHVDRPVYSLSSQLGFIPEENFDALELSKNYVLGGNSGGNRNIILNLDNFPHITNSDSHYLNDIGAVYSEFETDDLSIESLRNLLNRYQISMKIAKNRQS